MWLKQQQQQQHTGAVTNLLFFKKKEDANQNKGQFLTHKNGGENLKWRET